MLLSRDKRTEVFLTGNYRGLRIFQPARRDTQPGDSVHRMAPPDTNSTPQHALRRNSSVRELALK